MGFKVSGGTIISTNETTDIDHHNNNNYNNNNNNNNNSMMSEEKEEVDSVEDVEAEVIADEEGGSDHKDFSTYIENLPHEIAQNEGSPTARGRTDPPAAGARKEDGKPAAAAKAGTSPATVTATVVNTSPLKPRKPRNDPKHRDAWMAMYDQLKEFRRINGHANVPYHRPPNLTSLMSWCHSQRRAYRTNKMDPERQHLLEAVGFRWNAPKRGAKEGTKITFEMRLAQLKAYIAAHGTCQIDMTTLDEEELALANWCTTQRLNYHQAKLHADKVHQLDALPGWEWGLPPPPKTDNGGNNKRTLAANDDNMPAAKRTKVDATPTKKAAPKGPPAPPTPDDVEWDDMFGKLRNYYKKHRNCDVHRSKNLGSVALERWVRHQKQLLRKEDLPRSRMERLHRLGFEFPPGVTPATYQSKKLPAAPSPTKGAATTTTTKTTPMAQAQGKRPTEQQPAQVKPGTVPGVGTFPSFPTWNPYYGYNYYTMQFQQQQAAAAAAAGQAAGAYPGAAAAAAAAAAAKPAAASNAAAGAKGGAKGNTSNATSIQLQAQNAMLRSQNDSLQAMQRENAKLREENETLQSMHRSMMTSMEEEKMVRRQGNQELQAKIEKQEQIMTIQGSTIKKQGQQIKQLMDQLRDVVTHQKEQQAVQEELKQYQAQLKQKEQAEQEAQRQRDMAELQRQQEAQELAEAQRRQEQQRLQEQQAQYRILNSRFNY